MQKATPISGVIKRIFVPACLALLPLFCQGCHTAQASGPPSLSEVVLVGIRSPHELKTGGETKNSQACIQRYLAAIPEKSWLWDFRPTASPEDAQANRRRNLIEQICVIHGEASRGTAEALCAAMPLGGEWEGMSEGPLAEADYAGQWLKEHPDTDIAPFVHLLMAHRLRAGYEAAKAGHEKGLWPVLAKRYKASLMSARASGNALIPCIADDLDAQAYIYLEGQGRP